jgi:hypothetical protein
MKYLFLIHFNSKEWLDSPWEVVDTGGELVGRFASYFDAKEEAKKYAI